MMKTAALIWGLFFLLLGLLGMIPSFAMEGTIFGVLTANPLYGALYWITGVIGLLVGISSQQAARFYFEVTGVVYALLAIFGFFQGARQLSESIPFSSTSTWFHTIIAVVALALGYLWRREPQKRTHRYGS